MKIISLITLLCLTCTLPAAEPPKPIKEPPVIKLEESELFKAKEFSLELGAGAAIGNAQRSKDDISYGISLGGNYWFTKGFGLGVRAEGKDFHGLLVDRVEARMSVRAPLVKFAAFAPYGFVGGARLLETDRWEVGAGGGLEWRPWDRVGIFVEAGPYLNTHGDGRLRGMAGFRVPLNFLK